MPATTYLHVLLLRECARSLYVLARLCALCTAGLTLMHRRVAARMDAVLLPHIGSTR